MVSKKPKKSKDLVGDSHESLIFGDLDDKVNGIRNDDAKDGTYVPPDSCLEFTCKCRNHIAEKDGYEYHVTPVNELENLDFIGKIVSINGIKRHCHSLDVVDGEIVIFVTYDSTVT